MGVNYATARPRRARENVALDAEPYTNRPFVTFIGRFLGGELKGTADATLFLELALRGYDLSKLRDPANETTAEIIKLG